MSNMKLALFLPFAVLCAPTCIAQETAQPTGHGMVVARDAETGQLRAPTAAEFRTLQQKQQQQQHLQRSSASVAASRPSIVVGPGGRRSVRLGESNLVYSVVTRDSSGKLVEQCVDGAHAAEQAIAQAAPSGQHQERIHESR